MTEPVAGSAEAAKGKESRPTKFLPTDRVSFPKQLEALRAYATGSSQGATAVDNAAAGALVGLAKHTISLLNPFFIENGFLAKVDGGFLPTSHVLNFARAHQWNSETAPQRLAPLVSASWFGQAILPRLQFRNLTDDEAIQLLGEASTAPTRYRANLEILLEYLVAAGLVVKENGAMRAVPVGAEPAPPREKAGVEMMQPEMTVREVQAPRAAVTTAFSQNSEGAGLVQFHISVKVDMGEFRTWTPSRISAFFGGIAQVLAAKAALEKEGGEA